MTNIITTGYSYSLLVLSVISILGLVATGHNISLHDTGQIKFIVEAIIFLLTGFALLNRKPNTDIVILILLALTALSLIDIYLEIIHEGNSIGLTALLLILVALTLYQIFNRIKSLSGQPNDK
jgi:hypothetical protein